ncbi:hypothetical protein ARSQ2_00448 [Arsenophonus endosymbiont of Bemisia tabaci Q2]|nr:hypothetical protein ARSQ2_00448 [Arsenophonus endosymbiont of Bemisia tabaci Q2]
MITKTNSLSIQLHGIVNHVITTRAYYLYHIAKRLNFDDIIYMSYSIDFRRKVIFTIEEEGLSIRETAKQC